MPARRLCASVVAAPKASPTRTTISIAGSNPTSTKARMAARWLASQAGSALLKDPANPTADDACRHPESRGGDQSEFNTH